MTSYSFIPVQANWLLGLWMSLSGADQSTFEWEAFSKAQTNQVHKCLYGFSVFFFPEATAALQKTSFLSCRDSSRILKLSHVQLWEGLHIVRIRSWNVWESQKKRKKEKKLHNICSWIIFFPDGFSSRMRALGMARPSLSVNDSVRRSRQLVCTSTRLPCPSQPPQKKRKKSGSLASTIAVPTLPLIGGAVVNAQWLRTARARLKVCAEPSPALSATGSHGTSRGSSWSEYRQRKSDSP